LKNPLKIEYSNQQTRRSIIIVITVSVILIVRLFFLQIVDQSNYQTMSLNNRLELVPIPPTRGIIYDRHGQILAENIPAYQLTIVPAQTHNLDETIKKVQSIIPITNDDLSHFNQIRAYHSKFDPILLQTKLTEAEAAKIYVHLFELPGIRIKPILIRHYPKGKAFASILGYVSQINDDEHHSIDPRNYRGTTMIGKAGFEKYAESMLHGTTGYLAMETNAMGRSIRTLTQNQATAGQSITLSIDSTLQQLAYDTLGHEQGAIVAIDPSNGQILALVSKPSYDPNLFAQGIDASVYKALQQQSGNPMYNRASKGQYAQGSTIKPFIALAGLNQDVITPNTTIQDPGHFQLTNNSHIYRDWLAKGHGKVNVFKALVVSCDTFFYRLAYKLGMNRIKLMLDQFGFGHKTGVEMPDESSGLVPSRDWKYDKKGEPWYSGDTILSGIGQGFMLATPIQLAQTMAVFAMHGAAYKPTLIHSIKLPGKPSKPYQSPALAKIILKHEYIWRYLVRAMNQVVMSRDPIGTGYRFGRDVHYQVAAKTGTVQVYRPKDGKFIPQPQLPKKLRDNALFIAFAPIKHPKIAIAVVIEHVSSTTAARAARKIMDAYLLKEKPHAET